MADKHLTEAEWKKFAKGRTFKNADLRNALADWDKSEKATPEAQQKVLEDLGKAADALRKANKGDKELAAYLDDLDDALTKQQKATEQAIQQAKAEAEKAAEEATPALLTSKMVALVRQVPKGDTMQAMIAMAGTQTAVLLSRKSITPPLRKLLAEYLGSPSGIKYIVGECLFEQKAHTFVVQAQAAGLAKRVKAALLAQTELRVKVRVRGAEPGDVDDDGDDDAPAAESAPSGDTAATAKAAEASETGKQEQDAEEAAFEALRSTLDPQLQQALRAAPERRVAMMAVWEYAVEQAENGGFKKALLALTKLKSTIAQVLAAPAGGDAPAAGAPAQAAAASPDEAVKARITGMLPALKAATAAAHPALAEIKGGIAEAGALAQRKDFAAANTRLDRVEALLAPGTIEIDWPQAREAWRSALEAVDAQLNAVRSAMLASGDADFLRIADMGLPALTRNHRTPVLTAVFEVDQASGAARAAASQRAGKAVAAFRAHVSSDRRFQALDDASGTAFGVTLTLRRTLGDALDALAQALGHMAVPTKEQAR